jgi:beta-aspartyl-peptidase (threonine type)
MFVETKLILKCKRRPLFIALSMLILAAQVLAAGSEQPADAKKAIMQVLTDQQAAWNKGDLKAFMAGYQRSNEITFYSGDTVQKGYDSVLQRYQKKYQGEGKEMGKVTFSDIDIELLGADSALVRGRWQLQMSKEMPGGLFTLIFRKTPEGWRIVHDHTSSGER